MSNCRKTSFCELKFKDVINICDGRMLGRVIDIIIDVSCGRITGIIVPGERSFNFFRRQEDVFIPWRNILRIGEDVILVEIIIKDTSCRVKPSRKGLSSHGYAAAMSMDYSESVEVQEDELKPKVLKYITASIKDEDD